MKPPLTKQKRKWSENRDVVLRGTKLSYNVAQQDRYVNALEKLIKQMTTETKKQIEKLFRGDIAESFFQQQKEAEAMDASIASKSKILMNALTKRFTMLFASKASDFAKSMLNQVTKSSKTSLHSSLTKLTGGLSLKTGVVPEGMTDVTTALIAENVSLIKSIPSEYFTDITGSVMRSIATGEGIKELIPQIEKYEGQTYRRAKNLALDQTRKAYNSINKQKLQALGIKQFEWLHSSGGQRPRESHIKISGHIFSFDNLENEQAALGVPEADRGIPGYPINCKCVMGPVISFDTDE